MIKGIMAGYWMTYTTALLRNADILAFKIFGICYPTTRGHNSLNVRFGARKRKGRTLSFGTYLRVPSSKGFSIGIWTTAHRQISS